MKIWDSSEYLTADEVKERYGKGQGSLYYYRDQGRLQPYTFPGDNKTYWKTSDLDALVNGPPVEGGARPNRRKKIAA